MLIIWNVTLGSDSRGTLVDSFVMLEPQWSGWIEEFAPGRPRTGPDLMGQSAPELRARSVAATLDSITLLTVGVKLLTG